MWGVGCILFEMAAGRPMFPGSTVDEELQLIFKTLGKTSLEIAYLSTLTGRHKVKASEIVLHRHHRSAVRGYGIFQLTHVCHNISPIKYVPWTWTVLNLSDKNNSSEIPQIVIKCQK